MQLLVWSNAPKFMASTLACLYSRYGLWSSSLKTNVQGYLTLTNRIQVAIFKKRNSVCTCLRRYTSQKLPRAELNLNRIGCMDSYISDSSLRLQIATLVFISLLAGQYRANQQTPILNLPYGELKSKRFRCGWRDKKCIHVASSSEYCFKARQLNYL